jgi:hypothetical protein
MYCQLLSVIIIGCIILMYFNTEGFTTSAGSYDIYHSDTDYLMVYKKDNWTYVQRTPRQAFARKTGEALLNDDMSSIYNPGVVYNKPNKLDFNLYNFYNGNYYGMVTNNDGVSVLSIEYTNNTVKTTYTINNWMPTSIIWMK